MGVSGPCFDLVLLFREMVETLLQTVQAYRMSQYLSRPALNRLYVALLVLNCWMMALVHLLFHRSSTSRYFASLLCDLVLDIASSIGVPFALVVSYSKDADTNLSNLFGLKWFEVIWVANASSEFQLILVVSWSDLVSKLVFAISMIGTLNTLKRFVGITLDRTKAPNWRQRWSAIVPACKLDSDQRTKSWTLLALQTSNDAVKTHPILTKFLQTVFAVWGMAVLVLHLVAESNAKIPGCVVQVWPWGILQPSCNLMLVNCYTENFVGSKLDVHERLQALYPPALTSVIIRHCPSLEVPPIIKTFSSMKAIKIYNSSVSKWDLDAALTKTSHPEIYMLMMIRVTTKGGLLPMGLQSPDFPPSLFLLGFIASNIHQLPNDLDSKWPAGIVVNCDSGNFRRIPATLLRMRPHALFFAANPIEFVGSEIFELRGIDSIDLRDTRINALPDNVTNPATTLTSINLDGTNVTSFPSWIDEWLTFPGPLTFSERISAAGSPYCADRDRIFAGEQFAFSTPSTAERSRLQDASRDNWDYLKRGVACTPTIMYRYPLGLEDLFSRVS